MTKFEGVWRQVDGTGLYTFKGNRVSYKLGLLSRNATFTYSDTEITFIPAFSDMMTGWTQGYLISGDELTLHPDGAHIHGTFIKHDLL